MKMTDADGGRAMQRQKPHTQSIAHQQKQMPQSQSKAMEKKEEFPLFFFFCRGDCFQRGPVYVFYV
jgi:hypothetical protein